MIYQTEVDGVPTLLAPSDGPMRAGLVFRVGIADETLPTTGITHLVEHLALYRHGVADYHYNGLTSATETHFHVQGSPDDVVTYLSGVCEGLARLPMERLEIEKGILATEAAGRAISPLPRWRHGARDYGLTGYPEWGVTQLRPDDVHAWAVSWFTRANAVLWITRDAVPPCLRLRLPEGTRRPLPAPSSALTRTPACVTLPGDVVRFDALVDRSMPAIMFSGVLERQLFRDLRQDGGFSYTIGTGYERRGPGTAVVTALADGRPTAYDAVIGGMTDALAALRHGRVEESDLKALVIQSQDRGQRPDADADRLPMVAVDVLTGQPAYTSEQRLEQAQAVDAAAIAEVARQAWATGLLMVPPGYDGQWAGLTPASKPIGQSEVGRSEVGSASTGQQYKAGDDADTSLLLGSELASMTTPVGSFVVRFDAVAGLLAWPDGARQLIGLDGTSLAIEPTRFGLDATVVAALTAGVRPSQIIWMPARNPDDIPTVQSWKAQRAGVTGQGATDGGGSVLGLVVLSVLAAMPTAVLLLMSLLMIGNPEATGAFWFGMAMFWTIPLLLWFWVYQLARKRRPRRN